MKKISILVIILLLGVILAGPSLAIGKNRLDVVKIVIDHSFHHLGDDYIPSFLLPEPEDLYWETSFRLNKLVFRNKEIAYVKFLVHNGGDAIVINDNRITINPIDYEGPNMQNFFVYIIPIPLNFLLEGDNIIRFESGWIPHASSWDDFEFGELEMCFQ